jgi:cytochrome c553
MRRMLRWLAVAALCFAAAAQAQSGRVPMPKLEVDKSTTCVAPPEVMRRTHMDLLLHRRDRTVHQGVRDGDQALTRCLECHASRTTGAAIGSRDAFCQSCHDYVGVKLDCFDCHQGSPGAMATRR